MRSSQKLLTKKRIVVLTIILVIMFGGSFLFNSIKPNKKTLALSSLSLVNKISSFLPIEEDSKKELDVVNQLVQELTKQDNIERKFLLLLQNNMELRPGGGFLGQYAVIKLKNGEVTYSYFEDANLLAKNDRWNAVINRLYYACFYAVIALLIIH